MTTPPAAGRDMQRRDAVRGLSALAIATPTIGACAGDADTGDAGDEATDAEATDGAGVCVLFPEQTAGPFYFDPELLRSDLTEVKPGIPLRLRVRVLEAGDCTPIIDAAVDVWHTDALGWYSGYAGQGDEGDEDTSGQTFLRGIQSTDREGFAEFLTIYPGWYPGRTTHIHVKVHIGDTTVATAQLYFPDDVSSVVYAQAPYDARGSKPVANDSDGIFAGAGGAQAMLELVRQDAGYLATIEMVVA